MLEDDLHLIALSTSAFW